MDYLLPTAAEVPPVEVLVTEDAPTPLGAKGAGEGGTAAAGAAIANGVSDALGAEAAQGVEGFVLQLSDFGTPATIERFMQTVAPGVRAAGGA